MYIFNAMLHFILRPRLFDVDLSTSVFLAQYWLKGTAGDKKLNIVTSWNNGISSNKVQNVKNNTVKANLRSAQTLHVQIFK